MNEQELKDKIADKVYEILRKSSTLQEGKRVLMLDVNGINKVAERVAYSLIAADIGDVSEWKHRAEVAERAVREFAVQVGCKSCPFYCRCGIDSPNAKNDYQECYEAILRQAEKELQEERKDD